jgi:DNA-binding transcriptional regulator YiaG
VGSRWYDLAATAAAFTRGRGHHAHPEPPDRAYAFRDWQERAIAAVLDAAIEDAPAWADAVAAGIDRGRASSHRAAAYFDAHGWEDIWAAYRDLQVGETAAAIVTLRLEGREFGEIADTVSSTADAVEKRYERTIEMMRSRLEEPGVVPNVGDPVYIYGGGSADSDINDAVERTRRRLASSPRAELTRLRPGGARALREHAGLTVRAVARMLGVPHSTVSRWEQGSRMPRDTERSRAYLEQLKALGRRARRRT